MKAQYSDHPTRPVRLSQATRTFASESLGHKYGLDTRKTPCVTLDHIADFEKKSDLGKYDAAIREIVYKAPVRICPGEKLSGAATLGNAIDHVIPASFQEQPVFASISHLTIDFAEVLHFGMNYVREKAEKSLSRFSSNNEFLQSCLSCIDSMEIWHKRYLKELELHPELEQNLKNLRQVPFRPARNFHEAVQCIWFVFAFVRLCGNWPGIGRIDVLLGDYLKKDLENGVLTLDEAREILAHFFIKGCEWVCGGNYGSGDAQHYQNLVLAGIGPDGNDVANEVTYLVLDILEELAISDFPTTVRISRQTDARLLKRVAEVIRLGGGTVAVYNEDLILEALQDYGYPEEEIPDFANDGCWEVQIPGKTFFSYSPFDSLRLLQHVTLNDYEPDMEFDTFESLYQTYISDLKDQLEQIFQSRASVFQDTETTPAPQKSIQGKYQNSDSWYWKPNTPCTVVSLFEHPCIERGLSYLEGGTQYYVTSPHIGGVVDTVNSLYTIRKLVFEEKRISFREFMEVLKHNWEGAEPLRQYVRSQYHYFGNDNDEVDLLAARLLDDFSDLCGELEGRCPIRFPAGISTFGRQIEWSPFRMASPHGRMEKEILSGNFSPTPGTDLDGATAIIKSYCKTNLKKQVNGAALDINLLPSSVTGETGVSMIVSLIRSFVDLGGYFMQMDVLDRQTLYDAQEHPENYQNLSVRVSGWNARFVTLDREWQEMVIERTPS